MSLSSFRSYWLNNSTLNNALPAASKLFLDYVPAGTQFPYCRFSVISNPRTDTVTAAHIELFNYQLSIFNTDLDALCSLADSVMAQLDNATIDASTMRNRRANKRMMGEVVDGRYVYSYILEYEWSYNSTAG